MKRFGTFQEEARKEQMEKKIKETALPGKWSIKVSEWGLTAHQHSLGH